MKRLGWERPRVEAGGTSVDVDGGEPMVDDEDTEEILGLEI